MPAFLSVDYYESRVLVISLGTLLYTVFDFIRDCVFTGATDFFWAEGYLFGGSLSFFFGGSALSFDGSTGSGVGSSTSISFSVYFTLMIYSHSCRLLKKLKGSLKSEIRNNLKLTFIPFFVFLNSKIKINLIYINNIIYLYN